MKTFVTLLIVSALTCATIGFIQGCSSQGWHYYFTEGNLTYEY